MLKTNILTFIFVIASISFLNGQNSSLRNLSQPSDAKTRSISPENFSGEKGKGGTATLEEGSAARAARDLGQGWKVNPYVRIPAGSTFTLAEIDGPGAIQCVARQFLNKTVFEAPSKGECSSIGGTPGETCRLSGILFHRCLHRNAEMLH